MTHAVRMLDEALQWHEAPLGDFLLEQTDFTVVGVLGKKGVGKSTLMSMLAAGGGVSGGVDAFKAASKHGAHHTTNGVQAFVTVERTILLDFQVRVYLIDELKISEKDWDYVLRTASFSSKTLPS